MRIVFFTSMYPSPWNPGRGVFNRQLVNALAASHDVKVVVPVSWTDKLLRPRAELLADSAEYPTFLHVPRGFRDKYTELMELSIGRGLTRTIRAFQADVVLAYWAHPDGEVASRCAHAAGIPSVVMVGGSDVLVLSKTSRRHVIKRALDAADLIVAVSEHLAGRVVALGVASERVKVNYRGIDRRTFCPGESEASRRLLGLPQRRLAVCVSRLVPVKRIDQLLDVWNVLRHQPDVPGLCIVGDGPGRAELQRRSAAMGLSEFVSFVGPVEHSQLPHWYRAANVTVLSSESEGIPNALLESMCCGTPFVSTDVGGISEIADANIDRLVPFGQIHDFAAAVSEVIGRGASRAPRRYLPIDGATSAVNLAGILRQASAAIAGRSEVVLAGA